MNLTIIPVVFQPAAQPVDLDFEGPFWRGANVLELARDWQDNAAPESLRTTAHAVRTRDHLCFGFTCHFTELDMDDPAAPGFDPARERHALWERDVCEAFVRSPLEPDPRVYKEFEIAPNGQFCDLLVDRRTMFKDWEWQSGMQVLHAIDDAARVYRVAMAIPFRVFDLTPQPGDCWHANLFRIARLDGRRQYLAFSPTLTPQPNFHIAERFARLEFID
ncbi:MAG: carbohydrate-binding family 9-like protein [Blastocatellia bacterium]